MGTWEMMIQHWVDELLIEGLMQMPIELVDGLGAKSRQMIKGDGS